MCQQPSSNQPTPIRKGTVPVPPARPVVSVSKNRAPARFTSAQSASRASRPNCSPPRPAKSASRMRPYWADAGRRCANTCTGPGPRSSMAPAITWAAILGAGASTCPAPGGADAGSSGRGARRRLSRARRPTRRLAAATTAAGTAAASRWGLGLQPSPPSAPVAGGSGVAAASSDGGGGRRARRRLSGTRMGSREQPKGPAPPPCAAGGPRRPGTPRRGQGPAAGRCRRRGRAGQSAL